MSIEPKHTPGPWRWELNEQSKSLQLVGGRPEYDLYRFDDSQDWDDGMKEATR